MTDKPTLTGSTLTLRPITGADASAMFESLADDEGMRLTGTTQQFTLEDVQRHCARVSGADDRFDFAVTLHGNPAYRGEVVLNNIDWRNRSANFRIGLCAALRGQGYGTEATRLVLRFAFAELHLHRVELEVYDFNPRARRVYEKVGFVYEGTRRHALLWDGEWHDAIGMSMLEADAVRIGLTAQDGHP